MLGQAVLPLFPMRRPIRLLLPLLLLLVPHAVAYSVLTHEAIIDRNWQDEIQPLLVARFPGATAEQLQQAHAYAYGGAIIQDMGYYPFGSKFFSDLAHYTRSGDFIAALLQDSEDINDYAFALGALAHYASDNEGHPVAVNRAVPMLFPKLGREYGPEVTYEDDPAAHLKTEFAFDVVQVARGRYASEDYHDFIGFKVARPLLARAFQETYGLKLEDVFSDLDLALGTYRYTVSQIIPEMTKTAWSSKKKDIQQLEAGMTRRKFVYRMSRAHYHQEWNRNYERPGLGARFLAFLFHLIPKIGPFKVFAFKVPTPEAEKLFFASFRDTMQRYRSLLDEVKLRSLQLDNANFDTGRPTRLGDYRMADQTYGQLLERLNGSAGAVSGDLRAHILAFYQASGEPASKKARATLAVLRARQ